MVWYGPTIPYWLIVVVGMVVAPLLFVRLRTHLSRVCIERMPRSIFYATTEWCWMIAAAGAIYYHNVPRTTPNQPFSSEATLLL